MSANATKLSGAERAAIFLVSIGEEASAALLKQLTDEEVKAVSKAIARLESVPAEQTEALLEDAYQSVLGSGARGGIQFAKRVLNSAFGPDGARRISEHLPKEGKQTSKNIE